MNKPTIQDRNGVATVIGKDGEKLKEFSTRDHGKSYLSAAQLWLQQNYDKCMQEGWGDDPADESPKKAIEGILSRHVINHPKGLNLISKHGLPNVLNAIDEIAYHHSRGMAGHGIGSSDGRAFIDSLHAHLGEKSPFNESFVQQNLQEKLTADMSIADVIRDFVHSDDKRFAGKSKEERIEMAKGAYYSMQKEEAENLDELFSKKDPSKPPKLKKKSPGVQAAIAGVATGLALNWAKKAAKRMGVSHLIPPTVASAGAVGALAHSAAKKHNEMVDNLLQHNVGSKVKVKNEDDSFHGEVVGHSIEENKPLVHVKDDYGNVHKAHLNTVKHYNLEENKFFSSIMIKLEEQKKKKEKKKGERRVGRPKKEETVPSFHEQLNKIIDQGPLGTGTVKFRDGSTHPVTREHAMKAIRVIRSWSGPGIKPDDREANMAHISASREHFDGHVGAGPKVDTKFVRKPGTENDWIETKPDDKSWQEKVAQRMKDRVKGK